MNKSIAICPKCKFKLTERLKDLFCTNIKCENSLNPFKKVNEKVVLVDFENSVIDYDSLIKSNAKSNVLRNQRQSIFKKSIFKILNGSSIKTTQNLDLIKNILSAKKELNILIVGGGTIGSGMQSFLNFFNKSIISFDVYYSDNIDFIADCHSIPVSDKSMDLVIIQAVLEHVFDPVSVVNECYRVLKNNSYVYAETPFLQHVHEGAYDFTRFTPLGHRILFKSFKEIKSGYIGGVARSLLWSVEYTVSGIFRSRLIGKIFKTFFFWIRFFDYLIPDSWNNDGACGCFFIGEKNNNFKEKNPKTYLLGYKGAQ
jgi:SAM-dependent methyltransferase